MNDRQIENLSIRLLGLIKSADKILISAHKNPDGDAISSVGAMVELLVELGKDFTAVSVSQLPENYNFLPHFEKIKTVDEDFSLDEYDLAIIVDSPTTARTGLKKLEKNSQLQIACIDHHISMNEKYVIDLRRDTAASTTEVIYDFFIANNLKFNNSSSSNILTGILTDTANFLYPSTSSKTIEIASEMMLSGARLPKILERTWHNKTLPAMKLWGLAMSGLEINKKYNIAYTILTSADIINSQVEPAELDGIAGFLSNLHGVKAIIFLTEEDGGIIKGSLRSSHPDINVSKLAQAMGGGGHEKAAAFRIKGKIERVGERWKIV